jgi:hypothetical protein
MSQRGDGVATGGGEGRVNFPASIDLSGAGMTSTGVRGFLLWTGIMRVGAAGTREGEEWEGDSGESALPICNIVENSPVSSFPFFPLAALLVDFMGSMP